VEGRGFAVRGHLEDFFGTDRQSAAAVEAEVAGDARTGSVGADDEARPDRGRPVAAHQTEGAAPPAGVARAQRQPHAGVDRDGGRRLVQRRHVTHPELVAVADQADGAAHAGGMEDHTADRRPEVFAERLSVAGTPAGCAEKIRTQIAPSGVNHVIRALTDRRLVPAFTGRDLDGVADADGQLRLVHDQIMPVPAWGEEGAGRRPDAHGSTRNACAPPGTGRVRYRYDAVGAVSDSFEGPYSERWTAGAGAGHDNFFEDHRGSQGRPVGDVLPEPGPGLPEGPGARRRRRRARRRTAGVDRPAVSAGMGRAPHAATRH
jgi:hypothetical protein